eukprot:scaffold22788_cov18-Tisochrysis_lutea.AAC.1
MRPASSGARLECSRMTGCLMSLTFSSSRRQWFTISSTCKGWAHQYMQFTLITDPSFSSSWQQWSRSQAPARGGCTSTCISHSSLSPPSPAPASSGLLLSGCYSGAAISSTPAILSTKQLPWTAQSVKSVTRRCCKESGLWLLWADIVQQPEAAARRCYVDAGL